LRCDALRGGEKTVIGGEGQDASAFAQNAIARRRDAFLKSARRV